MNVRIEYAPAPIRHIAVECPNCGRWYDGRDIADRELSYASDFYTAAFTCPVCGAHFGCFISEDCEPNVTECGSAEEVYDGVLRRKEVWE